MLEGLFGTLQACLPSQNQGSIPCKLIVECSRMRSGEYPEFLVAIVGHPDKNFRFHRLDLDAYISRRSPPLDPCGVVLVNNQTNALGYLEAGLLNVLQSTGFGEVMLTFQRDCFICKVTVSYRKEL